MPTWLEDADKLCEDSVQVGNMHERQSADDDIDLSVRYRKSVHVAAVELAVRDLRLRYRKHVGGAVDADDRMAQGREVGRVSAGAAGGVQGHAGGQAIKDLPDNRLLQVDELVPRQVVERCRGAIAVHGRDRGRSGSLAECWSGVQQMLDLRQSSLGEVSAVLAGEGTKEGDTLEPKQVGKGVLIDRAELESSIGGWCRGRLARGRRVSHGLSFSKM